MFKDRIKFLGVCVLLSSIIISVTLLYCNLHSSDRYKFFKDTTNSKFYITDSKTGKVYTDKFIVDFIKRTSKPSEIN